MNMLDITRAVIDRLWKPIGLILFVLVDIVLISIWLGVAFTVALILFIGLIALIMAHGSAIYFALYGALSKHARMVKAKLAPKFGDIAGEIKAVAAARAELNSQKATVKAARKEQKQAHKAAKQAANDAAKAYKALWITALTKEDVAAEAKTAADARDKADEMVFRARVTNKDLEFNLEGLEKVTERFRNAVPTYRNSKSTAASTS